MGAGNKLDPTQFEVADIHDTSVDPLARIIRRECRKLGIEKLKVVYSKEPPVIPRFEVKDGVRRSTPGSAAFVPGAAGLLMAAEIVKDLITAE
jgi:Dinucleotide-utilizing enzymes involved in molybdopterin and thiamine biosynthesis family 1